MTLTAAECYFHPNDDNDCATVGFKAADDRYVLLSRTLFPTEQDLRLGLEGIYIELNDQGFSCYQGISAVSVFPGSMRIDLNEHGFAALKVATIEIHHDLSPAHSWQMRQVLAIVLDGFAPCSDRC
jgi:hypothetical protein